MAGEAAKRAGVHWVLPIPVRVLLLDGDRHVSQVLEDRFSPICRFQTAHSIRQADMRMGLASTPFDAFIVAADLPDGSGFEWARRIRDGGERARTVIIAKGADLDLPTRAAAAGASFVALSDSETWLSCGMRCFLERVATEHLVRQLLRHYADERGFSDAEAQIFEAALWVDAPRLAPLLGREDGEVASTVAAMLDKSGLHSLECGIIAALIRALLESLNGAGFDD